MVKTPVNKIKIRRVVDNFVQEVPENVAINRVRKGFWQCVDDNKTFSFIIPYMYNEEREELLYKCINSIPIQSKNKDTKIEICIHEVGKISKLDITKINRDIKFKFSKYCDIFNRAWTINKCVKQLATNKYLIIMDGDLILSQKWFDEIKCLMFPTIAWGKMVYLDLESTIKFIKTNDLQDYKKIKIRNPHILGAAGGVTFIKTDDFYKVKGIPENFPGWGAEDNAFMLKLIAFGYKLEKVKSTVYHMYHKHKTNRCNCSINEIKLEEMKGWNKLNWENNNKSWGN